jgi:AraC-like DNA-binding protein
VTEEVRAYSPNGMPELQVLEVKNSPKACRQFHETYSIAVINRFPKNMAEWRYRGQRRRSMSGEAMLMEPGEMHVTDKIVGLGSYFVLFIPAAVVENCFQGAGMGQSPHLKEACLARPGLVRRLIKLHSVLSGNRPVLEKQSSLVDAFSALFEEVGEKPPARIAGSSYPALKRVKDFLWNHWREDVCLEELASLSGLSRYHLLRAFSLQFGLPPHAYQLQVRLEKGREMLGRGLPLSRLDIGFSDQSHFTRHFKRVFGITPGRYAEMVRKPMSGALLYPVQAA